MKILLTGATGFIGGRLLAALTAQGHEVTCVSRRPPAGHRHAVKVSAAASAYTDSTLRQDSGGTTWIRLNYADARHASQWTEALDGCQVVINAAGILQSRGRHTLELIHAQAPRALFEAARQQGIARIIHISALGADEHASSAYHLTKKAGDDYLRGLGIPYVILQPSLVFGPEGASAHLFMAMASLPLIPLPGQGGAMIQPVHIDDLVLAVLCLLAGPAGNMPGVLPVVGPMPLTLRAYYDALRATLGIRRQGRYAAIPIPLVATAARFGDILKFGLLNSDTLAMLQRGNTGDPEPLQKLIGHAARPAERFVEPAYATAVAARARLAWLLPLLRWSIALVWLVTAVVSAFGYPLVDSYSLLERSGVPEPLRPLALYGAIALDLLFGIALLAPRRPRWIWGAQAGLIIAYTLIITIRLPEFWLHPYGPLIKNIPMLAALWLLHQLEDRPWTS
jgi:uncharacterized protein YbjT (DUF2867 family)